VLTEAGVVNELTVESTAEKKVRIISAVMSRAIIETRTRIQGVNARKYLNAKLFLSGLVSRRIWLGSSVRSSGCSVFFGGIISCIGLSGEEIIFIKVLFVADAIIQMIM